MRILVAYRSIPHAPGYATGDSMVRAFRQIGHEVYPYAKIHLHDQWLKPPPGFRPDLLLRMECGDNEPQYEELALLPCKKVYWTFDVSRYPQRESAIIGHLQPDLVLTGNSNFEGWQGAEYMPYAVDPDLFHPGDQQREGCAIIGSPFTDRQAFADAAGVELISDLTQADYAIRLRGLKVHVHHLASGGTGLLVMRPWETMGSRTVLLTERDQAHKLHPDIPWLTYRDAHHCRERVEYLLSEPEHCKDVASFQHSAVMAGHTYQHRARAILGMMG